jgi:hypothetical protein
VEQSNTGQGGAVCDAAPTIENPPSSMVVERRAQSMGLRTAGLGNAYLGMIGSKHTETFPLLQGIAESVVCRLL